MSPLTKISFVTIFLFSFSAQAQQSPVTEQDWIIRNQQNILEENRRNKEFEDIEKDRELRKKEEQEDQTKFKASGKPAKCVPIKELRLVGADSLSSFRQKKLTSPFIGKCFDADLLSEIVATINNYYHNHGYVTTQVLVPKQNIESGIFELQVIEGKIEKISFGKDRFTDDMQKFTAFGKAEGKTLDVNEINQGVYQINRLRSNQATMKIEPGSKDGLSKIIIENQKKFPIRLTAARDNLGNKFTGIQRTTFSSSIDNALFLNDNINLSYTRNLHDDHAVTDIESFTGGISIPFKANTFSYSFYRTEYKGTSSGTNEPIVTTGFSQQSKFDLDRVFLNRANLRISANTSLTLKSAASYQLHVKQTNSERQLSIFNAGLAVSSSFNNGVSLYFKPTYIHGLTLMNATKDQKNTPAATAKAQFEAAKLYATISKRLTIPKLNKPLVIASEMDSQLSKQTLFGSEQFAVGGYYSVRGFRENYISADSGYYFRNKLSFSPGFKLTFEPFYDYGYAKNKYDASSGRLSGAGIKTIFSHQYFNASLTYAEVLSRSHLITSNTRENQMLYFELSASCC